MQRSSLSERMLLATQVGCIGPTSRNPGSRIGPTAL
jgi:hypothetical protein